MSEEWMRKIAESAAEQAVSKFAEKHPCRFSEPEAETLHEFHRAKVEEAGDGGTFRVIIQFGRTVQDMTKKVRRTMLVLILMLLVLAFGRDGYAYILKFLGR